MDGILALALFGAAIVFGWQTTGVAVSVVLAAIGVALLCYMRVRAGVFARDLSIHGSVGKWILTNYIIQLAVFTLLYGLGLLLGSMFG